MASLLRVPEQRLDGSEEAVLAVGLEREGRPVGSDPQFDLDVNGTSLAAQTQLDGFLINVLEGPGFARLAFDADNGGGDAFQFPGAFGDTAAATGEGRHIGGRAGRVDHGLAIARTAAGDGCGKGVDLAQQKGAAAEESQQQRSRWFVAVEVVDLHIACILACMLVCWLAFNDGGPQYR